MENDAKLIANFPTDYIKTEGTGRLGAHVQPNVAYTFILGVNPPAYITINDPNGGFYETAAIDAPGGVREKPNDATILTNTDVVLIEYYVKPKDNKLHENVTVDLHWESAWQTPDPGADSNDNFVQTYYNATDASEYLSTGAFTEASVTGNTYSISTDPLTFESNQEHIFVVGSYNNALPLTLLDFQAANSEEGIMLTWSTVNAFRSEGFWLERSLDGINYDNIAFITSVNSRQLVAYNYTDEAAMRIYSPQLFYRLTHLDFDGTNTIYTPISIEHLASPQRVLHIYPNPFSDQELSITVQSSSVNEMFCKIYNSNGKMLETIAIQSLQLEQLRNKLKAMPRGLYYLKVASSNGTESHKLIKQ